MTKDELRPLLKRAYDAGKADGRAEAGVRTFSDGAPRRVGQQFASESAERYATYFACDDRGRYEGRMHRRFGVDAQTFADRTGLALLSDGDKWYWTKPTVTKAFATDAGELGAFAAALQAAPDPEAFGAAVRRALAETGGDLGDAVELATALLAEDGAEWDEPAAEFAQSKAGKVQKTISLVSSKGKPYKKTIWVNAPKQPAQKPAPKAEPEPPPPSKAELKGKAAVAAKYAVAKAFENPAAVDPFALAEHLAHLTVAELKEIKARAKVKGGKTKDDHIVKLLAHLAGKKAAATQPPPVPSPAVTPAPAPAKPTEPAPVKPTKADAKAAAKQAISDAFASPATASPADLANNLAKLTIPELKELGKQHGGWLHKTKPKLVQALLGSFKTKQWAAGKVADQSAKLAKTKHFDKIPEDTFYEKATPSAQFKSEHPHASAKGTGDPDVEGIPNHELPDATRPPVPDKATAKAINNYTWGYDGPMNAALRDTGAPPPGPFGGTVYGKPHQDGPKMFGALQKVFAETKPFGPPPVTVHRGITSLPADLVNNMEAAAQKALASGGVVTMPGFISTSTAQKAAFEGPVSFTIHANQGVDVQPYSHFAHEKELLLNHNCEYKVKAVTRKLGKVHIELEQVSGGLAPAAPIVLDGKKYSAGAQTFAAPGPPPRPGLVWKEETHRWIHPDTGAEHPHEPAAPAQPKPVAPAPSPAVSLLPATATPAQTQPTTAAPAAPQQPAAAPAPATSAAPSDEINALAAALVNKSDLPPETRAEYTAHLSSALRKIPPGARAKVIDTLGRTKVVFHPDLAAVKAAWVAGGGKVAKGDEIAGHVGFVEAPSGRIGKLDLHLDGAGAGHSAEGVYAHELGHLCDLEGGMSGDARLTRDPKWQKAWDAEIKNGTGEKKLTAYARTSAAEGFAELHRHIVEKGVDDAKKRWPRSMKFLESKGLL